jgi:hypothetical protein
VLKELESVWDGFCYPLCSAKAKDDCEGKSQSKGNPQAGDPRGSALTLARKKAHAIEMMTVGCK